MNKDERTATVLHNKVYAEKYPAIYSGYLSKKVEKLLAIPTSKRVLVIDIGCGQGQQLRHFASINSNKTSIFLGCDCNQEMVTLAKQSTASEPRLHFYAFDVTTDATSIVKDISELCHASGEPITLYFTCLGNTLALIAPADYDALMDFIQTVIATTSPSLSNAFIEYRDGDKYSRWMGNGRTEVLVDLGYQDTPKAGKQTFAFQVVRPNDMKEQGGSNLTYAVDIYLVEVQPHEGATSHSTDASLQVISEPTAYFVNIELLLVKLQKHFITEDLELPAHAASGLKCGSLKLFALKGKR